MGNQVIERHLSQPQLPDYPYLSLRQAKLPKNCSGVVIPGDVIYLVLANAEEEDHGDGDLAVCGGDAHKNVFLTAAKGEGDYGGLFIREGGGDVHSAVGKAAAKIRLKDG
jgi:hypothetical protein